MCRLAAYVGPPVSLATILSDPPHSLEHQSYQPREMLSGTVNVDGTGVAWCPPSEEDDEPLVYASPGPLWTDETLRGLAPRIRATALLATVRSATPGLPSGEAAVLPFVADGLAFAHNGYVEGFGGEAGKALLDALDARASALVTTRTDSRALFAHLVARRRDHPDEPLVDALSAVVALVREVARAHGVAAQLNFAALDRGEIVAVRAAVGLKPNSLYLARTPQRWPGGLLVASEPLDDDHAWRGVPENGAVVLRQGEARVTEVDEKGGSR
jgi:glutamine amidotransferase